MNIYKFEFRMLIRSILIWVPSISVGLIFYMAFFPMMMEDASGFQVLMDSFPEEFLAFFGMNGDLPFSTIIGYYALTYSMIMIPIAIQAANYGFHILSVEERELTADFLLSKPVSRRQILVSKFLAAFTSLTITNAYIWVSTFIAIELFNGGDTYEYNNVIVLLSSIFFFQLFFISVGMFISVAIKKVSSVLSFSMGLGFGMYILGSFASMLSSNMFKVLTPYAHFNPNYILVHGHYEWGYALISITVSIAALIGTYFLYLKRNIASL